MNVNEFWQWANTNGGGLTAVATVALVVATVATLWFAGADSRRRSRPMVSASFVFGPNSPSSILFRIKNYGPTRAQHVEVKFVPAIPEDQTTRLVRNRYARPIGVLNPGETYDNSWFSPNFAKSGAAPTNNFQYPQKIRVVVTYKRFLFLKFKDVTDLDIATHLYTSDTVSSDSLLGSVRAIAAAAKQIASKS